LASGKLLEELISLPPKVRNYKGSMFF
jgi:hypothetical protein